MTPIIQRWVFNYINEQLLWYSGEEKSSEELEEWGLTGDETKDELDAMIKAHTKPQSK